MEILFLYQCPDKTLREYISRTASMVMKYHRREKLYQSLVRAFQKGILDSKAKSYLGMMEWNWKLKEQKILLYFLASYRSGIWTHRTGTYLRRLRRKRSDAISNRNRGNLRERWLTYRRRWKSWNFVVSDRNRLTSIIPMRIVPLLYKYQ